MRLTLGAIGVVAFVALGAMTATAGDKCCASKAKTAGVSTESASCDISKCMPKMVMMVGDEQFDCPHSAQQAADKEGKKVIYAVGKQQFECKDKAMAAYADVMDDFVVKFASVRTEAECKAKCTSACAEPCAAAKAGCCSGGKAKEVAAAGEAKAGSCSESKVKEVAAAGEAKTGSCSASKAKEAVAAADGKVRYCVAGRIFECKDEAEKTAKLVSVAMEKVKMSYRVDGKDFCCDKMAGAACKTTGKDMTFVVGETETPCQVTARIELDKAKVAAAVKALAETKVASRT